MLPSSFYSDLSEISGVQVRRDVPGSALSTFKLGGSLDCLVEVNSLTGLCQFVKLSAVFGLPFRLLGNGSNVLFPDAGIKYPVVKFGRELQRYFSLDRLYSDEDLLEVISKDGLGSCRDLTPAVFVYSAFSLMSLSRICAEQGLAGLEFAAGIPATLGGALYMNAGAHGSDISAVVQRVLIVNSDRGELSWVAQADSKYSYRHSVYQEEKLVVCGAELKFVQSEPQLVSEERARCLAYRKRTQPLSLPSAGSVFRNPGSGLPSAGELIERAGLSGQRIGGVMVSPLHANWIVKVSDEARAGDVVKLISLVQERVLERSEVSLHCEIDCWSV
ncbi:MAG: UDP-N-acetylmuramate dehydrogenase [bacterium]|nr:UDP-N-acetylmuramate dehydrogenase [bacterium]